MIQNFAGREIVETTEEIAGRVQAMTVVHPVMTAVRPVMTVVHPVMIETPPAMTAVRPVMTAVRPVMTAVRPVMTAVRQIMTAVRPVMTAVRLVMTVVLPILVTVHQIMTGTVQTRVILTAVPLTGRTMEILTNRITKPDAVETASIRAVAAMARRNGETPIARIKNQADINLPIQLWHKMPHASLQTI